MTRFKTALALLVAGPLMLAGCTSATLTQPVPVAVVQDTATALASYQAALGVAQVALQDDPTLLAKVNALAAQAAPFVAAAQSGVQQASTAPSLAALAAELLVEAAPYITAQPKA